ncbi:hypothetical protein [Ramlibacter sp. AN1133]|uniref:hypothetical protein n=1 Tax=Ramlibacter sp. AN1133 TaxID=3133429 RepID=UPI0030BB42DE
MKEETMDAKVQVPGPEELVVVRGSDLGELRRLLEQLSNSSSDEGCSDGLTVVDGRPLELLVKRMKQVATRPVMQSLRMVNTTSEHLESFLVIVPPDCSMEEARAAVLAASEEVTAGLGGAGEPDQDKFMSALEARGVPVHTSIEDFGIGDWDDPNVDAGEESEESAPQERGDRGG